MKTWVKKVLDLFLKIVVVILLMTTIMLYIWVCNKNAKLKILASENSAQLESKEREVKVLTSIVDSYEEILDLVSRSEPEPEPVKPEPEVKETTTTNNLLIEEISRLRREISSLPAKDSITSLSTENLTLTKKLLESESEIKKLKELKSDQILTQEVDKDKQAEEIDALQKRVEELEGQLKLASPEAKIEEVAQLKRERLNLEIEKKELEKEIGVLKAKLLILDSKKTSTEIITGEIDISDGELKTLLRTTFPDRETSRDVTFCKGHIVPVRYYQDSFDKNLSNLSPGKFISFLSTGVRGYVWTLKNNSWSLVPIIVAIDSSNKPDVYYYTKAGIVKAKGDKEITPFVLSASLFD